MALFVIADLHLSFGTDKPMDVFPGWENYTQKLEENWNRLVGDEDTVVIAGDISWAMKLEETKEDFTFIHRLPGKKLLLKGNHDYWWSTKTKIEQYLSANGFDDLSVVFNCAHEADGKIIFGTRGWLYNAATDEDIKIVNREVGRLRLSLEDAKKYPGEKVAFLHYPPVYDNMECTEILQVLLENDIKDCYFGHIHGKQAGRKAPTGEYKGIRMHLISCDYVGFAPVRVK